jgi:hypothetical protein
MSKLDDDIRLEVTAGERSHPSRGEISGLCPNIFSSRKGRLAFVDSGRAVR